MFLSEKLLVTSSGRTETRRYQLPNQLPTPGPGAPGPGAKQVSPLLPLSSLVFPLCPTPAVGRAVFSHKTLLAPYQGACGGQNPCGQCPRFWYVVQEN